MSSGVEGRESWDTWRRRLRELQQAVEAHLDRVVGLAVPEAHAAASGSARASARTDVDASEHGDSSGVDPGNHAASPAVAHSPGVQRALDHLARHYRRPVTLAELARVAGCSRERLSCALRRETGATVRMHLMRLRLAHAAREVGQGDKIEAVMLGVGYRGKRNFYRQFKARFGMTPARYRAEVRRGRR